MSLRKVATLSTEKQFIYVASVSVSASAGGSMQMEDMEHVVYTAYI